MLLSIVVPVFNGERYLEGCLDSIEVALTSASPGDRASVEVIVCDNHSTDRTLEIARSFSPACAARVIQPPVHEANRTRNWAHGLGQAAGEWLQMLHADDLLSPGGVAAQIDAITSPAATGAALVSGRHRTFEHDAEPGRLHPRIAFEGRIDGPRFARRVLPLHCPLVPFTLMRADAYASVGGLDERWQLVQDWELWMRMAVCGDVLMHEREVGRWRIHPTSPGYRRQNAAELIGLSESLEEIVPDLPPAVARWARTVARARAAVQLDGLGSGAPPVPGDLPKPAAARRVLRANGAYVSGRLYAMRAAAHAGRLVGAERD